MTRHNTGIGAALLAATLWAGGPAPAQEARPLVMDGTASVYQRVLTRPGAALASAPGAAGEDRFAAFQPLYVYAREGASVQVGRTTRAAEGWVEAGSVVDWRQNIVAAFTNSAGRSRQLIFDTEERLRALMEHEAVREMEADLLARADGGDLRGDEGIVAVEPTDFVNILEALYLMPILDFVEDVHPINYDPQLLLRLASVPLEEGPPPGAASGTGDFDAGVVFVLDTTRSMEPFIARTQTALTRIVEDIRGTEIGERINFGAVGFRDNVEAVPELEYRTRVLSQLERRTDQAPVLTALRDATAVAQASSPGFNEDSLAGVQDAVDLPGWDGGGDRFDGRYVILVTDAGPKDPGDPNARSAIGPAEVQRDAEGKGIVVMTLHLKTEAGGPANHDYAAGKYRVLSRFGTGEYYFPIEGGSEEAFEATVTRLVTALTDHVRAARGEATVLAPEEAGEDLLGLGLAMRLAYLGLRDGTQAPDIIEGWVSEKAVSDPARIAFEPRLLVTKNELATMAEYLEALVETGEATRGSESADDFFTRLQGIMARMAQNPDRLVNPQAETLGGALEFLDRLPYRSQIMDLTPDRWAQSAMERRVVLDTVRQKLEQYRKWLYDPAVWTALYDGAPDGDHVFAMPFDILP